MLVECGKERLDEALAGGRQFDGDPSTIILVRQTLNQPAALERLDDARQRPLRDAGLFGHVAGLLRVPDPQNPKDSEGDPTEVVLGQHRSLHVVAYRRAGAVHVGDRAHGGEVEVLALQARFDVLLGLEHDGG